jgi:hypothetical protein
MRLTPSSNDLHVIRSLSVTEAGLRRLQSRQEPAHRAPILRSSTP